MTASGSFDLFSYRFNNKNGTLANSASRRQRTLSRWYVILNIKRWLITTLWFYIFEWRCASFRRNGLINVKAACRNCNRNKSNLSLQTNYISRFEGFHVRKRITASSGVPSEDKNRVLGRHFIASDTSEGFVFNTCQFDVDMLQNWFFTYRFHQRYAFLKKNKFEGVNYCFFHLTEFHLISTTLNNLKIVISRMFVSRNPIVHLHKILTFCISCRWFTGISRPKRFFN